MRTADAVAPDPDSNRFPTTWDSALAQRPRGLGKEEVQSLYLTDFSRLSLLVTIPLPYSDKYLRRSAKAPTPRSRIMPHLEGCLDDALRKASELYLAQPKFGLILLKHNPQDRF